MNMKTICWKGEKYWLGKLLEHPEIMTQGETLKELKENLIDAHMLMTMGDVPVSRRNSGRTKPLDIAE
jgi:predicted RNase H-like HicB family nuclease